jgi:hypothetical protein
VPSASQLLIKQAGVEARAEVGLVDVLADDDQLLGAIEWFRRAGEEAKA